MEQLESIAQVLKIIDLSNRREVPLVSIPPPPASWNQVEGSEFAIAAVQPPQPSIVAAQPLQPSIVAAQPSQPSLSSDWPSMPNLDELISDSDLDVTPPKPVVPMSPFSSLGPFAWADVLAMGSPKTPARPAEDVDDDRKILEECMAATPLTASRHGITKSARPCAKTKAKAKGKTSPKKDTKDILSK